MSGEAFLGIKFFLEWFPKIALGFLFLIAVVKYSIEGEKVPKFFRPLSNMSYLQLIWSAIAVHIVKAFLGTILQYYVWSQSGFTRRLLTLSANRPENDSILFKYLSPLFDGSSGYFISYAIGRFWLNVVFVILLSFLFREFLVFLKKYRTRFFEEGEVELGFLMCLVAGWPNLLLFIAFAFVAVVLVSLIRLIFFKKRYTTLGMPFLAATLPLVIWGNAFTELFGLWVLKI